MAQKSFGKPKLPMFPFTRKSQKLVHNSDLLDAVVSVVIPCYNYARFLPEAVASVLGQTRVGLEVIIVDDASSDDSAAIALELAILDERISVVIHDQNMGHIATYNDGLARATGDYVVLLSADDVLSPGSLFRSLELLEANPRVGFVYGFSPEFDTLLPSARTAVRNWSVWAGDEWIFQCCKHGKNFVYTPEVVMRTVAYQEIGGYESDLPHAADLYLWLRTAARWDVGRVNGVDQAFYRVHGKNMHMTSYAGVITDLRERCRTFEKFFAVDGAILANTSRDKELTKKSISHEAINLAVSSLGGNTTDIELAELFADEALKLNPVIRTERLWRKYLRARRRTEAGRRAGLEERLDFLVDTLRGKIRWRLWRWRGI